ncbi:hypothetical protein [Streptomyces sp. NPDC048845]|uniref:hypothetical protein n=1 Tax=Streptomyces sp. NPDC048845 TaxID=3155390 RepID=UPI00344695B1
MPDRRRRAALSLPTLPTAVLRDRRPPSASSALRGDGRDRDGRGGRGTRPGTDRDNPFAPPPEGRPDQEWRPRNPEGGDGSGGSGPGGDGSGGSGSGGSGSGHEGDGQRQNWGRWSSRQPGRHTGGFGTGPRQNGQGGGPGGPGPGGLRWDPTDPNQRRARYALLAGMWGFFFALFSLPEIAMLLGALALYWGVSSLRGKAGRDTGRNGNGKPETPRATAADVSGGTPGHEQTAPAGRGDVPPGAPGPAQNGSRPQTTSAVSGLVTGSLALLIVAATYTFQLVYQDYYTCVEDALTRSSEQNCEKLLPEQLRPLLTTQE